MITFEEFLVKYTAEHPHIYYPKGAKYLLECARKAWGRYQDSLITDRTHSYWVSALKSGKTSLDEIRSVFELRRGWETYQRLYAGKIDFFKKGK